MQRSCQPLTCNAACQSLTEDFLHEGMSMTSVPRTLTSGEQRSSRWGLWATDMLTKSMKSDLSKYNLQSSWVKDQSHSFSMMQNQQRWKVYNKIKNARLIWNVPTCVCVCAFIYENRSAYESCCIILFLMWLHLADRTGDLFHQPACQGNVLWGSPEPTSGASEMASLASCLHRSIALRYPTPCHCLYLGNIWRSLNISQYSSWIKVLSFLECMLMYVNICTLSLHGFLLMSTSSLSILGRSCH